MKLTQEDIIKIASAIRAELQPEYMTATQVAQMLQVGDDFVYAQYKLLGGRYIPGKKSKALRFRRADVDAALIDPTVKARLAL